MTSSTDVKPILLISIPAVSESDPSPAAKVRVATVRTATSVLEVVGTLRRDGNISAWGTEDKNPEGFKLGTAHGQKELIRAGLMASRALGYAPAAPVERSSAVVDALVSGTMQAQILKLQKDGNGRLDLLVLVDLAVAAQSGINAAVAAQHFDA